MWSNTEIRPGPMYIIGQGPMCHMVLAYNRQVCHPENQREKVVTPPNRQKERVVTQTNHQKERKLTQRHRSGLVLDLGIPQDTT